MKKQILIIAILILFISPVNACATVVFNPTNGSDITSFRRDSDVQANITIVNNNGTWVESKPGFVHTIVFPDGWTITIGGSDGKFINGLLVWVGYIAHEYNNKNIGYLAIPLQVLQGNGHFTIKDNNSEVFYSVNGNGWVVDTVKLQDGQALIAPNDANMVHLVYINSSIQALNEDPFGTNHRWILSWQDNNYSLNMTNHTTEECLINPDIIL